MIVSLDALECPPHPKLTAHKRQARYLMYHDFGTEEGVSGKQVGTNTGGRYGWWNNITDTVIASIHNFSWLQQQKVGQMTSSW